MTNFLITRLFASILALSLTLPIIASAQSASNSQAIAPVVPVVIFKDIDQKSALGEAAQFLQSQGIIGGYPDGTFHPNQKVGRAEAIKMIVSPLIKKESLALLTTTPFTDVKPTDWYLPYVEAARQNKIIDGPPTKPQFNGAKPIAKMEFIKMLLLAYKIDPNTYSEIKLPLATDVTDTSAWYYPYLRYSLSASLTMVSKDGTLAPGQELTRGDTALLLYRYIMYRNGRRTQALLSEAESEILVVLGNLNPQTLEQAEYASARALIAARGANATASNDSIVQGALKVTESFRAIVRGFRAGVSQQYDDAIRLCGDAWNLAASAKTLSPALATVSEQIQSISKQIADSARTAKTSPPAAAAAPTPTK
ncbi:MAG: S-layer homology domain-containing protein [Candidatus Peregrinibacteria bacterium]